MYAPTHALAPLHTAHTAARARLLPFPSGLQLFTARYVTKTRLDGDNYCIVMNANAALHTLQSAWCSSSVCSFVPALWFCLSALLPS